MGWHEWHTYHWYGKPGVYAIYEGEELLYIGKAANVESRLLGHHVFARLVWQRMKAGLSLSAIRVKIRYTLAGDQNVREARLIRKLRPPLNMAFPGL